MEEDMWEDHG